MQMEQLALNGLIIYADESGSFILEKKETNINKKKKEKKEFATFDSAYNDALEFIKQVDEWKAIIRYNRGLGVEYKSIDIFYASSKEEAKEIALKEAEKLLGDYIIEVKIQPSGR